MQQDNPVIDPNAAVVNTTPAPTVSTDATVTMTPAPVADVTTTVTETPVPVEVPAQTVVTEQVVTTPTETPAA